MLDSMAPIDTDPSAPGRVLFEPGELERELDQLMVDLQDLRARVRQLVRQTSDAAGANGTEHQARSEHEGNGKGKGKKHKKKVQGKKQKSAT